MHRTRAVSIALLVLTACGGGGLSTGGAERAQPLTVENCAHTTVYETYPERVVAVNQPTVEAVLSLGVEDRVVGTSYAGHGFTGVSEDLQDAYEAIPVLSDTDVSREVLYGADPDFVVATFESSFGEERGMTRDVLAADGINSFVLYETCVADQPPTWRGVFNELETLGAILGAEEEATALTAEMDDMVGAVEAAVADRDRVDVFVFDSGDTAPYTAGATGIVELVLQTAGGRNVFDDLDRAWGEVTWEEVVARDPEAIIVNDYEDPTHGAASLESKLELIRTMPALSEVSAVVEDRIYVVSLHDFFLGPRNAPVAAEIARFLHPGVAP